jgi:hypothetical protein
MFSYSNKITNVIHNYEPIDNGIILIKGDHEKSFLEVINFENESLLQIKDDTAYDFINLHNNIVFTNKLADKSYAFNKISGKVGRLPYTLHIKGLRYKDQYLCYSQIDDHECWVVLSTDSLDILSQYPTDLGLGAVHTFLGDKFISQNQRKGLIALYAFSNIELWKLDISQHAKTENNKLNIIDSTYFHENRIYILCGHTIICTSIDGNILWKNELSFRPFIMGIDKNTGYIISSNKLVSLDLTTGHINYSKKNDTITWSEKKLHFHGSHPQIHNEKLWCNVQTSGHNFIASIEPQSGNVEWLMNITTPYFITPPKFKNDKMYILDNGGNLFAYEDKNLITGE